MIASLPTDWWRHLPVVNATLNGASAVLLVWAFVMIKRGRVYRHAALMICAFITSSVFLACYVTYHWHKWKEHEGVTRFPQGPWHRWYILILVSHTGLAMVILPLIFGTFFLAWKRRWRQHHQLGSITFPLWCYVSVTGVVVYWMLYHLAPTLK